MLVRVKVWVLPASSQLGRANTSAEAAVGDIDTSTIIRAAMACWINIATRAGYVIHLFNSFSILYPTLDDLYTIQRSTVRIFGHPGKEAW